MANRVIFILGGARSGKSTYAQELAARLGEKVLFVATAEALDRDMAARIEQHKRSRPGHWRTLETSAEVGRRLDHQIGDAEVVVLDCLTLLVANVMSRGDGPDSGSGSSAEAGTAERVAAEIEGLIACISRHDATFIVVSNEVGLGLVPDNDLGRAYRDLLGRANQTLARHAGEVYFMVAGIPLPVKGGTELS